MNAGCVHKRATTVSTARLQSSASDPIIATLDLSQVIKIYMYFDVFHVKCAILIVRIQYVMPFFLNYANVAWHESHDSARNSDAILFTCLYPFDFFTLSTD